MSKKYSVFCSIIYVCLCMCMCVCGVYTYIHTYIYIYDLKYTHTHTHTGMNISSNVSEKLLVEVASGENCRKYTIVGRLTFHHMLF